MHRKNNSLLSLRPLPHLILLSALVLFLETILGEMGRIHNNNKFNLFSVVEAQTPAATNTPSPMPGLPDYMPENSHCFSHVDVAFCVGGDVVSGKTLTTFVNLISYNSVYQQGPTLDGIVIQGRHAITLISGYLVLCQGCGSDPARFGDTLYQLDIALYFRCMQGLGGPSTHGCFATDGVDRLGFTVIAKMPYLRSMASLTYIPFTGQYGVGRGALYVVGGLEKSGTSSVFALSALSVAVTIGESHVVPDSEIVKSNVTNATSQEIAWRHSTLPSYFANALDAGLEAFPMLERVILFFNKSYQTPSNLVVTYVVGQFNRTSGGVTFADFFPGYLAQIPSSLNHMSNVVVDGHVAYFSTYEGDLWLVDASDTWQTGATPSRALSYGESVYFGDNASSVASLFRTPPGFGVNNPSLIIANIRDTSVNASSRPVGQIAVQLFPSVNIQSSSSYSYTGSGVSVNILLHCYFTSTQNVRIATGPDCATPVNPAVDKFLCSFATGNVQFTFNVTPGTRDLSICVDKGRCPLATFNYPSLVTASSAVCTSNAGSAISGCLQQSCCVNFDRSTSQNNLCLATMPTTNETLISTGQLVSEYVLGALNTIQFPHTRTRTATRPTTTTTTTTSTTTTMTETHLTNASFPASSTTTVPSDVTSFTTSHGDNNGSTTTHEPHTTTTSTTTPSPGNSNNNGDDSGLPTSTAIYATGGGIGFIIIVALVYVVYKNNVSDGGKGCCGKDQGDNDDEDGKKSARKHSARNGGSANLGSGGQKDSKDSSNGGATTTTTQRTRPKVGSSDPMSIIPQFSVVSKIGRGGFGDVYSVRRKTDGEVYALKIYRLQTFQDSSDEDNNHNNKESQNFSSITNERSGGGGDGGAVQSVLSPEQSPLSGGDVGQAPHLADINNNNNNNSSPYLAAASSNNNNGSDGEFLRTASGNNGDHSSRSYGSALNKNESTLSARTNLDAFNNHHGSRQATQIVRVATLQKVGALAFKEQRIMRKLHRETHGRVVRPVEVYVHGSMDGAAQQQQQQLREQYGPENSEYYHSNNNGAADGTSAGDMSRASYATAGAAQKNTINASVAGTRPSGVYSPRNNNNNDDEATPLLAAEHSSNSINNNGKSRQNTNNNLAGLGNQSFNNNTRELHTTDSAGAASGPVPDPQQPISYAGSIVAGLFELIPDGNLFMYCKAFRDKSKPLPVPTMLRILAQIADVLHIMAHRSAGIIVHGDIKPENILLRIHNGTIAVGDFGTAIEYRRPTNTSSTNNNNNQRERSGSERSQYHNRPMMSKALSLLYAPPERIQGQAYADPALDWWSFGVLIYSSFAPKGRHTRSMAMDIARAAKQASSMMTMQRRESSNKNNENEGNGSNMEGVAAISIPDEAQELYNELIYEANEGGEGLAEELAKSVMLGSLALQPEKRMKPNTARDHLQKYLLAKFYPEHDPANPKNINSNVVMDEQKRVGAGLYDLGIPFALTP